MNERADKIQFFYQRNQRFVRIYDRVARAVRFSVRSLREISEIKLGLAEECETFFPLRSAGRVFLGKGCETFGLSTGKGLERAGRVGRKPGRRCMIYLPEIIRKLGQKCMIGVGFEAVSVGFEIA